MFPYLSLLNKLLSGIISTLEVEKVSNQVL